MSLNIRRSNQDPFYRYKMPPLQAKVEGKGNGIKTVVVNVSEVAKCLGRPPFCKYLYLSVKRKSEEWKRELGEGKSMDIDSIRVSHKAKSSNDV